MTAAAVGLHDRSATAAGALCAGAAAGAVAVVSPGSGLLLGAVCLGVVLATRIGVGGFACGLAAYLPFEGFVASHLPASTLLWVRYAPEALGAGMAAMLIASRIGRLRATYGPFGPLVLALLAVWAASMIANAVPLSTYVLGVRAELRYLPLAFLVAATATPLRTSRMLGATLAASALIQTAVALAEVVGGLAVRHLFAQSYTVQLGGMTVTHATIDRATAITGTLRTYNELAAYLVIGWALMALGGRRLGLPHRLVQAGLVLTPVAVLATGSREGTVALAVAAGFAARYRLGVPAFRIAAVAALAAALSLPWWAPSPAAADHSTSLASRVATRWSVVLDPSTWWGSYGSRNFRLFLARDEIASVMRHSPAFGWGTGTVDDPRTVASGANPLLQTMAGRLALMSNFAFDGSWSLLLVQTGVLGLMAMAAVIAWVALVGRSLVGRHWLGPVLVAGSCCVAVLGLFAPVLQQHALSCAYWSLAGCGIALHHHVSDIDPVWA